MAPELGGKILVLKQPWLMFILSGHKTMEVRGRALKPGRYYLGHKKLIWGECVLGQAILIATDEHWHAARDQHRVPLETSATKPYKKTFGLPILSVTAYDKKFPYTHPRGALGIVKYRY